MLEIELKAALRGVDEEALPSRMIALGFSPEYECREADAYYNGVSRDFRRTDEALRVREHTQDGVTRARVTYKGPKADAVSQTRPELETAVADAGTMRAILEALGYVPVLTVSKARHGYAGGGAYADVHLCLDTVDGLGAYLELEIVAPDGISATEKESRIALLLSLLDMLDIPRENLTRSSYLELLMARATS